MTIRKWMLGITLVFGLGMAVGCEKDTPAEKVADGIKDGANNLETNVENATN